MIVIVGLIVLLIAVIVGFTGVLANAGPAHPLTENFSVLGYHVTGFAFAHIVLVIGVILLVVGLLMMLMGRMGHAVGGRRHYY
jgi:uncharacterized membrane protein YtjA (UPF0391 family)